MGFVGLINTPNDVVTPNRHTTIEFDIDETVLGEPSWETSREGGEVARPSASGTATKNNYVGCYYWHAAQCWTLEPIQKDIKNLREISTYIGAIVVLNELSAVLWGANKSGLRSENTYKKPTDLNGVGGTLLSEPASDPFISKLITSPNGDYNIGNGDYVIPPIPGDIPSDRLVTSTSNFPADQAFFLRWSVPGTVETSPSAIITFHFGQYAVTFRGDGVCVLFENIPDNSGNPNFIARFEFRYARAGDIAFKAQTLAIWPSRDAQGKRYLVFSNAINDAAGGALTLSNNNFHSLSTQSSSYSVDSGLRGSDVDQSPGFVTKSNKIGLEMRRDLKVKFQISRIMFATQGTLIDLPDALPLGSSATVTCLPQFYAPNTQCTITAALKNAEDRSPFTQGGVKPGSAKGAKPYVELTFKGDGATTPILFGYRLTKPPVTTLVQPGVFTAYNWGKVNVSSFDGEPSSQTASLMIRDPLGVLSRLRNRGRLSSRISTTFVPPGTQTPVSVVLHRGYVFRPDAEKKGKPGRIYPNEQWRDFDLQLVGVWKRLLERVEHTVNRIFAFDETAPLDPITHQRPPYTVTRAIRALLQLAGFANSEINIPELSIRLWPGAGGAPDEVHIKPEAGYAEAISRLARNYLGGYVFYDGQAAQWRLLQPTPFFVTPPTPIFNFVTSQHNAIGIPTLLAQYPANTAPVLSEPKFLNDPLEFNLVYVACPVPIDNKSWGVKYSNWLHNPKSYNANGFPATADPEHPDYIGYPVPCVIFDPTLYGRATGSMNAAQITQAAVDFTVNRIYDFVCHTRRYIRFLSILSFVMDNEIQKWRPLRYGDPVSYNGVTYLIKSANIEYEHDILQLCNYELVLPVADAE